MPYLLTRRNKMKTRVCSTREVEMVDYELSLMRTVSLRFDLGNRERCIVYLLNEIITGDACV